MNSIDVSVEFSFKGELYKSSLTFDFEQLAYDAKGLPDLYQLLAKESQIDTYSYLYEVMESSELIFTNPQGLAKSFYENGQFQLEQFLTSFKEYRLVKKLEKLAIEEMGNLSLNDNTALKNTLLKAYQLGKQEIQGS